MPDSAPPRSLLPPELLAVIPSPVLNNLQTWSWSWSMVFPLLPNPSQPPTCLASL